MQTNEERQLRLDCLREAVKHIIAKENNNVMVLIEPVTLAKEFYDFVESGQLPANLPTGSQMVSLTP